MLAQAHVYGAICPHGASSLYFATGTTALGRGYKKKQKLSKKQRAALEAAAAAASAGDEVEAVVDDSLTEQLASGVGAAPTAPSGAQRPIAAPADDARTVRVRRWGRHVDRRLVDLLEEMADDRVELRVGDVLATRGALFAPVVATQAAAADSEVETTAALATGGGRARTLFCGVGYFGGDTERPEAPASGALRWRAAARAA